MLNIMLTSLWFLWGLLLYAVIAGTHRGLFI